MNTQRVCVYSNPILEVFFDGFLESFASTTKECLARWNKSDQRCKTSAEEKEHFPNTFVLFQNPPLSTSESLPVTNAVETSVTRRLSANISSETTEQYGNSQVETSPSRSNFPIWAKTLAFTIGLGAIFAAAIMLPIVLTNILNGKTTTTTTSTSK